jgi:hypothetical protein
VADSKGRLVAHLVAHRSPHCRLIRSASEWLLVQRMLAANNSRNAPGIYRHLSADRLSDSPKMRKAVSKSKRGHGSNRDQFETASSVALVVPERLAHHPEPIACKAEAGQYRSSHPSPLAPVVPRSLPNHRLSCFHSSTSAKHADDVLRVPRGLLEVDLSALCTARNLAPNCQVALLMRSVTYTSVISSNKVHRRLAQLVPRGTHGI